VNVLSFFFDGVPQEEKNIENPSSDSLLSVLQDSSSTLIAISENPEMHYHQPFQQKNCHACHDQGSVGDLLTDIPDLCYSCHEDYSKKFKYLHGPIEMGFCNSCHKPHMSEAEKLLISPNNQLCFHCHVIYQVKQPESHIEIGDAKCIECHDPHGQNTPYSTR
jgi:predicted CXXCH cytochrome family protein